MNNKIAMKPKSPSPLAGEVRRGGVREKLGSTESPLALETGDISLSREGRGSNWPIKPATEADWPGIWSIFRDITATGDTYAYAADMPEAEARDMWMGQGKYGTGAQAFVMREGGNVLGTFSLRANHFGHGGHVANAAYMVAKQARGRGIARALCDFSMKEAKRRGFTSMQFNYVVSTNTPAIRLWQAMGFKIIGISPKSFRHNELGYVDIYIMHRFLDDILL